MRGKPLPRNFRLAQLNPFLAGGSDGSGDGPRFIGRTEELKKLFAIGKRANEATQFVLVSGGPGSGRGTLLEEFRNRAPLELPALVTARPINIGQRRELNALLGEVISNLRDLGIGGFGSFERRQREYEAKRKGQPSPTASTVRAARDVVSAGAVLAPGGAALSPLLKPVLERTADYVTDKLSGSGESPAVIAAFVDDFRHACDELRRGAQSRSGAPAAICLLFENFDSVASGDTVNELIEKVLQPLSDCPLLVIATVERADKLFRTLRDALNGRVEEIPLDFFDEKDTREFARQLGLTRPEAIAQVVTITKGSPQRLAVLRTYYRANPAARSLPAIPPEALRLAASEEAAALASTLASEFLANLARAAAALRWFNATLLEEIANAAGLQPASEEKVRPADLLRRGVGPLWIARAERGWTFDRPERRESMLQEMREYYPSMFMHVSLAAATYHRRQIDQMEPNPGPEPAASAAAPARLDWLLSYRSEWPQQRRYSDLDYVASLREWLYHCLAAEPSRAFGKLMDHVAEAMFEDRTDVALQLLDIGPEVRLAAAERRRIELLRDVMRSLQGPNYEEARQQLRQLDQLWPHSTIIKVVETFHRGVCEFNLDHKPEALTWFEQNQRRLEELVKPGADGKIDRLAARIFCLNSTWLAYSHSNVDVQIETLDEAVKVAADADEKEMLSELHRVRGLIYQDDEQTDDAIREFELALVGVDQFADLSSRLLIKRDLSAAYRAAGRYADAERQLEEADSIVHVVPVASERDREMNVVRIKLERLRVALAQKQAAEVSRLTKEILAESTSDDIVNDAGLALFETDDWVTADEAFIRAIELKPDVATYYHNRATALAQTQQVKDALLQLSECLTRGGKYEVAPWVQSWLLNSVSDPGEQSAILQRALELFPDDVELKFKRFEILWQLEATPAAANPDAADTASTPTRTPAQPDRQPLIDLLDELLEAAPTNNDIAMRRAEIALEQQEFARARRLAEEVCRRNSEETRARRILDRARYARSLQREVDESWSNTVLPILIQVSPDLDNWVDNESVAGVEFFRAMIPALREDVLRGIGLDLPGVRVQSTDELPDRSIVIAINEVPRHAVSINEDYLVDAEEFTDPVVAFPRTTLPWRGGGEGYWLTEEQLTSLPELPTKFWDPRGVILHALADVLTECGDELLTSETVNGWLPESLQSDLTFGPRLGAAARVVLRERVSLHGVAALLADEDDPPPRGSRAALQSWLLERLS